MLFVYLELLAHRVLPAWPVVVAMGAVWLVCYLELSAHRVLPAWPIVVGAVRLVHAVHLVTTRAADDDGGLRTGVR